MADYYFIASMLPPLVLGQKPEMSFYELTSYFATNLKPKDYEKTRAIRRMVDIYNLRSLWMGHPIDRRGNLSEKELEESLITQTDLPPYVFDFTAKYEKDEQRVRYFPWLIHKFFEREIRLNSGFLKEYFSFERELRLVLVGLRAKQLKKDVVVELQFEDAFDPIVSQILAQKDAKTYEPPDGYENIKMIFENRHLTPLELQAALNEYRFLRIDEMLEGELFSIDRILGYMIQLTIAEQWYELNTQEGLKIVDSIVKEIK